MCATDGRGNRLSLQQDVVDGQYVVQLFKALKQTPEHQDVSSAPARTRSKTQVWTALIAMLVLKYLQLKSKFTWSLSTLAALLRQQLFFYRDLWVWLDDPFQAPEPPAALPHNWRWPGSSGTAACFPRYRPWLN